MQRRLRFVFVALTALATVLIPLAPVAQGQAVAPGRLYLPLIARQPPPETEVRLLAAADAYVDQDEPALNFGSDYFLPAGNDQPVAPAEGVMRVLIRFDLPNRAGASVTRAVLRVNYRGFWDYPDRPRVIAVQAAVGEWAEQSVTWYSQPARAAEVDGSTTINANDQFGYREIDVTALVKKWYEGSLANDGLYLSGPEAAGSDASYRVFLSRESVETNLPYPPELVITFG